MPSDFKYYIMRKALKQKENNFLNETILDNGHLVTRFEYLKEKIDKGFSPEVHKEPKVAFNRRRYNRMTSTEEQDIYEKKCNETKSVYYLITECLKYKIKINKTMFNYCKEIIQE